MDSDHHLPSHTAGTEDGIPRQACSHDGKHVAIVLREADCDASTLACATSPATVITWLEMHRGTVRAAAATFPQESGRNGAGRVCRSGSLPQAEVLHKREDRNHALRGGFSMLPEVREKQLGALSIPGL
ncbi:hypothetical protein TcBrA4_0110670 [Trypanosoma cruzi]|nr:hypothetical protein TcBrA4_0110670 [Trypanosoma cruzi]